MDVMGTVAIWSAYVRELMGNDTQVEVAAETGIRQATLSRWLNPKEVDADAKPSPGNVAALCRYYHRNPLEGFVAARLLDLADAQAGLDEEALERLARLYGAVRIKGDKSPTTKAPRAKRVPNQRG